MNLKIKAIIKKGKDQEEILTTRLRFQRKDSSMKKFDDNRS